MFDGDAGIPESDGAGEGGGGGDTSSKLILLSLLATKTKINQSFEIVFFFCCTYH